MKCLPDEYYRNRWCISSHCYSECRERNGCVFEDYETYTKRQELRSRADRTVYVLAPDPEGVRAFLTKSVAEAWLTGHDYYNTGDGWWATDKLPCLHKRLYLNEVVLIESESDDSK